jgi:hypothetical protein
LKRCIAFIRLLLLDDDGPAHHDCRLRVLAAAGANREQKVADVVDCSNWPLAQLEEWEGEGGVVELSKVVQNIAAVVCLNISSDSPFSSLQNVRLILPMAQDGEHFVPDNVLLHVMHACGFNPGSLPNLELPDCF